MVPLTRRTALRAGGLAMLSALPGCSLPSSRPSLLNVAVFNHSESPYTIELSLFRNDGSSSSRGARIYDRSLDVEPEGDIRRENAVKNRPYLVRYSVYENNRRPTDEDHVHYYPADSPGEAYLAFDIDSTGVLTRR